MSWRKRIAVALPAMMLGAAAPALEAAEQGCGEAVNVAALVANPAAYHGKALWVVAHVTIDFENMTACPSEKDTRTERCLWLQIDSPGTTTGAENDRYERYQARRAVWNRYNLQTVAVRATFDRNERGHFSMWPGGLGNVTEVANHQGGWNFAAGAAVARTSCVRDLPAPKETAERLIHLGALKHKNDDVDGAIADFSRAMELAPADSRAAMLRGNAYKRKRDYAGAIADYSRAIELNPEYREVLYSMRGSTKELAGDLDGATADFTEAIRLNPTYPDAYNERGRVRQKQGDRQGAEQDFSRANALSKDRRSK